MSSYKKLINNTLIFGLGRLGSNILSFILVPIFTYYLSSEEYGTVDLIVTTVTMLMPIVSLNIYDAILRFVMDGSEKEESVILGNGLFLSGLSYIFFVFIIILIHKIFGLFDFEIIIVMIILLGVQIIERIFGEFARAQGKIKVFALNGILLTFTSGILNIIFLMFLHYKVIGYIVSLIISNIISIIFLMCHIKDSLIFKPNNFNRTLSTNMLYFTIPLIPNTLMWWLINASSRYFISFFLGVSYNGIFAVATKIPTLINIVNQIFTQAWQLSAIEEYKSVKKSEFYSSVFNYLSSVLLLGVSFILIILKPLIGFVFANEYYIAWTVVPFLLLGTVFSSFSSFLGANYVAAKKTKGVFRTSVVGGGVSLLMNLLLIPRLGMLGAGVSSMISFGLIWITRYFDTRTLIDFEINFKKIISIISIIGIQIVILWFNFFLGLEIFLQFLCVFFIIFLIRKDFKAILTLVSNKNKN